MGLDILMVSKKTQHENPVLNWYFTKSLVYTRDQHHFNHLRSNLIFSYKSCLPSAGAGMMQVCLQSSISFLSVPSTLLFLKQS